MQPEGWSSLALEARCRCSDVKSMTWRRVRGALHACKRGDMELWWRAAGVATCRVTLTLESKSAMEV